MLKNIKIQQISLGLGLVSLALFFLLWMSFYPDILWFSEVNYLSVYLKILMVRVSFFLGFAVLAGLFIGINLMIARSVGQKNRLNKRTAQRGSIAYFIEVIRESMFGGKAPEEGEIDITPVDDTWVKILLGVAACGLGLFLGSLAASKWEIFLKFINATPFQKVDPLFGKDIGFYVFKLPFLTFLKSWLVLLTVFTTLIVSWIYFSDSVVQLTSGRLEIPNSAKRHVLFLITIFFLLMAWHYRLDMFSLLYSPRGVAYGASYTDIHATLPGMWFSLVISLIIAVIAGISAFMSLPWTVLISTLALWILGLIFFHGFYALFIQKFVVGPNEITKEKPFIEYNIQYTKEAYGLGNVEERDFPYNPQLTGAAVQQSNATIKNLRLWDPIPLRKTLRQIQAIRLYYDFNDVDIDRYIIDGEKRQVMLSARELFYEKIPARAQTWVNQHLKYTHGYGLTMVSVFDVLPDGMPKLLIKDIPPISKVISVKKPEIYFGEKTFPYIIVNTTTEEFDYPEGDKNKYSTYSGPGGINIGTFWRKLLYALYFKDFKIILSTYLKKDSKLFYVRQIKERIHKIAPFLSYDQDPYLVIDKNGQLFWIQDAYTLSDQYPYSEVFQHKFNYIRNSVKVIVNAYTGDTKFYLFDNEPIIQVYSKIFPGMFQSIEKIPEDLKVHFRYPENLFKIQADMYRMYHMNDAQVFYNQEDLWMNPQKSRGGNGKETMEPYYVMVQLPGNLDAEFLIMLPFTPNGKDNMIGWLSAMCDGENYGKLLLYRLPKQSLVYGPMQIDARIDQDAEISKELSLWGQKGSEVFRGNLFVVPIKNSILYIEPIYLQATSGQIPELKRIVAASGDSLGMGATLTEALNSLFGGRRRLDLTEQTPAQTAVEALNQYQNAKKALQRGDWRNFGDQFDNLEQTLKNLSRSK
ncbi:MAG: UPF0182 family protein [Candidatus Margulisbacteria bacterium]|nr:UPF0182 family protein [Candidatus Margulisiibacteriota bacterium]